MAVSKIKMSNARRALIAAGMSRTMARAGLKFLDLNEPLGPQIADLVEEDPELFGLDSDGNELPADDQDTDDEPMTAREAQVARLRGQGNPYAYKGKPRPDQKPTASKAAQENAEHLLKHSKTAPPPKRQWVEPVRDINAGHKPTERQRPTSADTLAAKLRGNA